MINDPLNPNNSPNTLKKSGVRRVNNLPLYLVLTGVIIFIVLLMMVMNKRAKQGMVKSKPQIIATTDSSQMVAEITAQYHDGIISPVNQSPNRPLALPIANADFDSPPKPHRLKPPSLRKKPKNPEFEHLLQMKIQQFQESLKGVMITSSKNSQNPVSKQNAEQEDFESNFKNELHTLQSRSQQRLASRKMSNEAFLEEPNNLENRWQLQSKIETPKTPFELKAGFIIPGVMDGGIKSNLPGQIKGHVGQNVYDTATGKYLLIPQGTGLVGKYSTNVVFGQDTLLVVWERLIFPDGKTFDLGAMPGADSAGYAGFRDEVDQHFIRIYGSALLMSGVIAGVTYSQRQNQGYFETQPSANSVLSAALGQQLGQTTTELLLKNINVAPTIKIRPGYEFNITVVKDLVFEKPYQSFDYRFTE